jgi:site-specific recombinase XerD
LAAAVVRELQGLYSRSTENSQEALVFSKSQGLPLAADNLRKKALRTACKRAGLQRIDWHTLRHTHGTLLHSQGTPLKVAQAQLGHSHMATTLDIYTHASGSAQRDAELARRAIVPKCSQVGELRKYCGNGKSVSSVS